MQRIDRNQAIKLISNQEMKVLNRESREGHILNYWSLDSDDIEFHKLSRELQNQILFNEYPTRDILSSCYDELIILSLKFKYKGVTNIYLRRCLDEYLKSYDVYGSMKILEPCPCCFYCTLDLRGEYEICPLCFWEDEGSINDKMPNLYSSPNHMSLIEFRNQFNKNKDISLKLKYPYRGKTIPK